MPAIHISLTTKSPVLLAAGPPAHNLIETLDFIPGNSLRGLLAEEYLKRGGKDSDPEFKRLFLSQETFFGFAYLDGSHPLPLSALSCKYHGGFLRDDGHGVRDRLYAKLVISQESGYCSFEQCGQLCGKPLDLFEGFWRPTIGANGKRRVNPAKRLITRTAIDPTLGTAAAARLFSQRVITEGQTFRATIEVPEDLAPILAKLLAHPFNAAIGTGRSRGQGWVEVREESFPQSSWDIAARRFEQFREATGKSLLIVTLLSDAIFQDDYLRDRTGPHAKDLRPLLDPLGLNMDEWEERPDRNLSFAATRLVFGFDGRPLFLPRPPRLAVSMGSVFGFQPQPGKTPIPPRGRGRGLGWIGHNRQEGFGRATLWHPFHLDPEKEWHYE